jgi:hypothetical protein
VRSRRFIAFRIAAADNCKLDSYSTSLSSGDRHPAVRSSSSGPNRDVYADNMNHQRPPPSALRVAALGHGQFAFEETTAW